MTIAFRHVSKSFGDRQVFSDLNLSFQAGMTTCIMGKSGCGKTTLLNLIMGLEKPDKGEIVGLSGQRITAVFQEDRLCMRLTAIKNVTLVLPKSSTWKQRAENKLLECGLEDKDLMKPVSQLSGGMMRRVAIVRACLAPSEIILMDEPFKGLDKSTCAIVRQFVQREAVGKTLILVTHDSADVVFFGGENVSL